MAVNETLLMQTLADRTQPAAGRAAAADALGTPAGLAANHEVWRVLCTVFQDPQEDTQVRIAAAAALSRRNRAAAPNQLCRYLEGDEDRRLRAHVVALLAQWDDVPNTMEPALRRDLDLLRQGMTPLPLVNLAMSYGADARVVATLTSALRHSDPTLRGVAQQGLGMLGKTELVLEALQDEAPQVRAAAAQTLGYYSLKAAADVAALEAALQDDDPRVQQAAKTALRRLGIRPTPRPSARRPVAKVQHSATSVAGSASAEWRTLLEQWSRQWLSVQEYAVELPDEVLAAGWLGYPGATEQLVQRLEQHLGRTLPPSYRAFLRVTNGWRRTTSFIEQVWSTADVDYFRVRNHDWIDILMRTSPVMTPEQHARSSGDPHQLMFRAEYLPETLQVSEVGDATVYLLNPAQVTLEGEWEAWCLASWSPGAERYRSFADLMRAEYARFVQMEKPTA